MININRKNRLAFLVGGLILLVMAVVAALQPGSDKPNDDVHVGKPLYSPDHKYMAIVFTESGGGAISPYCIRNVSVALASLEPANAYARKFRVYEGGCHSLGFTYRADAPPVLEDAPMLKWSGQRELDITFDPKLATSYVTKVLFLGQADEGRVKIVQKRY